MRRNIRERVEALAPFLTFDRRPVRRHRRRRPAVRGCWTRSRRPDTYPYSRHYRLGRDRINYMRQQRQGGRRRLRRHDDVLRVRRRRSDRRRLSRRCFPRCSRTRRRCRRACAAHVRYPGAAARAAGGGLRPVPHDRPGRCSTTARICGPSRSQVGQNAPAPSRATQAMEPNFVLMTLPGESEHRVRRDPAVHAREPEQPDRLDRRPQRRPTLRRRRSSTTFRRRRLVDGPLQIEARIDQNAQLSGQLSLWNQQGSRVRRGALIVIPVGRALLYAEPIYLQAERSPMPELRLVVLALQDRLAVRPDVRGGAGGDCSGSGASTLHHGRAQCRVRADARGASPRQRPTAPAAPDAKRADPRRRARSRRLPAARPAEGKLGRRARSSRR